MINIGKIDVKALKFKINKNGGSNILYLSSNGHLYPLTLQTPVLNLVGAG